MPRQRIALLMCVVCLVGCGDDISGPSTVEIVGLDAAAPADTLHAFGQAIKLKAVTLNGRGDTLSGAAVTWQSSDTAIVRISPGGLATAVADGAVTITATLSPSIADTLALVVHQVVGGVQIVLPADTLPEADSMLATVKARDSLGNLMTGRPVTWSAGPSDVVTITDDGMVVSLRPGPASVIAVVDGQSDTTAFAVTPGLLVRTITGSWSTGQFCGVGFEDSLPVCWGVGGPATRLSDTLRFRSMTAGYRITCGTTFDDRAFCLGIDIHGQMGLGTITGLGYDTLVAAVSAERFRFVMASDHDFVCGVTTAGTALCWGHNDEGQLARNRWSGDGPDPQPVVGVATLDTIDVDAVHACGLAPGGAPYCWGNWPNHRDSIAIAVGGGFHFTSLSVGSGHQCALDAAGLAYCWGAFETSSGVVVTDVPVPVEGGHVFTQLSAGSGYTCAVAPVGELWCWGANSSNQLGLADSATVTAPTRIPLPFTPIAVAAAWTTTCAISAFHTVLCWGAGDPTPRRVPPPVGGHPAPHAWGAVAEPHGK